MGIKRLLHNILKKFKKKKNNTKKERILCSESYVDQVTAINKWNWKNVLILLPQYLFQMQRVHIKLNHTVKFHCIQS